MKRTPKAPHPVEAHDAEIIANAVHFTAFQFRGRGDRRKIDEIPNVTVANARALEMLKERKDKPVMIYAVDAKGRQALSHTVEA